TPASSPRLRRAHNSWPRANTAGKASRAARSSCTSGCARVEPASVLPEGLEDFSVLLVVGAERQPRQAFLARLEGPLHLGCYTDRAEALVLLDPVTRPHAAAARQHDIDLLRLIVLVPERLALAGLQHLVGQARLLRAQFLAREMCLAHLLEAELRRAVDRLREVHHRVAHGAEPSAPPYVRQNPTVLALEVLFWLCCALIVWTQL